MNSCETPARLRRRLLWLAAGAALAGGAGIVVATGREAPPPTAAAAAPAAVLTVEAVTPRRETFARTLAASGAIAARDELLIGADVAGVRLLEVAADVGSVVRRGQLLARADDAALLAQLAQHNALLRQAEVEWAQARDNLQRAQSIEDSGVFSVEALQARRSAADAAAAKVDLVRAQRQELELQLAHTRVLAPADGVISRRAATVGAVLQPGAELFRLIRDEQLEWLAELPAPALAQVAPAAGARLRLEDGRVVEGSVRMVAPTIDNRSRNGVVHVSLPRGAAAASLRAGGHASGEIVVGDAGVLTLPEAAVLSRDGENFVWLLGADDVARRQRVATGPREGARVAVSGLAEQARVVATGAGFVKEGERLRVAAATQGARP